VALVPAEIGASLPGPDGRLYATRSEVMMAELLTRAGIAYTPHVSFELGPHGPANPRPVNFCPDFVFDGRPMVWQPRGQSPLIIHGFELKQEITRAANVRVLRLQRQRGIVIVVLHNRWVRRVHRDYFSPPYQARVRNLRHYLPLAPLEDRLLHLR
jgi:hypothetical protein